MPDFFCKHAQLIWWWLGDARCVRAHLSSESWHRRWFAWTRGRSKATGATHPRSLGIILRSYEIITNAQSQLDLLIPLIYFWDTTSQIHLHIHHVHSLQVVSSTTFQPFSSIKHLQAPITSGQHGPCMALPHLPRLVQHWEGELPAPACSTAVRSVALRPWRWHPGGLKMWDGKRNVASDLSQTYKYNYIYITWFKTI